GVQDQGKRLGLQKAVDALKTDAGRNAVLAILAQRRGSKGIDTAGRGGGGTDGFTIGKQLDVGTGLRVDGKAGRGVIGQAIFIVIAGIRGSVQAQQRIAEGGVHIVVEQSALGGNAFVQFVAAESEGKGFVDAKDRITKQ